MNSRFAMIGAAYAFCAMAIVTSQLTYAQTGQQVHRDEERSNPAALWSTPGDGRLVMLARNAAGINVPMPIRMRVCVTNLTGSNNSVNLYVWTTANPWDGTTAAAQQQTRHLELGDCVEIDRPAALIVQDSTISGTSSGYYQLMEQTPVPPSVTPPSQDRAVRVPQNKPRKDGRSIWFGEAKSATVRCENIVTPPGTTPTPTNDFYRRCDFRPVDPTKSQGVRICIGNNFVTWTNSPPQINYAAGLLELVIAPEYLPPTNKPQPYDYNWSPVTPNGCRDVIGTPAFTFLVGPNTTGGYWDASKVTGINITTQDIHWTEQ